MTTEKQIEQQVLETVRSKQYRPVKPRQIFKKLNLDDEKLFKKLIKRLIRDGRLVYGPQAPDFGWIKAAKGTQADRSKK